MPTGIPDLKPYFQTLQDVSPPLEWAAFFGNPQPVELEVGTGRGLFLLNAGTTRPDTNFLGVELEYKEGRYAAQRMKKRELPNVRILGGDARIVLAQFILDASVAAVHIYFPDPWWKRKHRGRRIFSTPLIAHVERILRAGGVLHAWTDVEEYFGVMQEVMASETGFTALPTPPERPAEHDLDYLTNYERKKRQNGQPIYRAAWQRLETPPRMTRQANLLQTAVRAGEATTAENE